MNNNSGIPNNTVLYENGPDGAFSGVKFLKELGAERAMPNILQGRQYWFGKFITRITVEPSDAHLYNLNLAGMAGNIEKESLDEMKLFVCVVWIRELQMAPFPAKDNWDAIDLIARNGGTFTSFIYALNGGAEPEFGDPVMVSYADPLTRQAGTFEYPLANGASSVGGEAMMEQLKQLFKQLGLSFPRGGGGKHGIVPLLVDSGKYIKQMKQIKKIPEMCAWIDRNGVIKPDKYIPVCKKLGFKRIGLFITGVPDVKIGEYKPFGGKAKVDSAVKKWLDAGIGVDFLVWVNPKGKYLDDMLDHFHELYTKYGENKAGGRFRLDMDTEEQWKEAPPFKGHNKRLTELIFNGKHDKSLAKNICLNDYGGLQEKNFNLLKTLDKKIKDIGGSPGCIRKPQAYAGGWSNRLKRKIHKKDVKWPTNIGPYSMSKKSKYGWAKFGGTPLEMGISIGNPMEGMSYREYILLQIWGCVKYKSERIWVWSLRMNQSEAKVFLQIKDGSWVEAKKVGISTKAVSSAGDKEKKAGSKKPPKPSKKKVISQVPFKRPKSLAATLKSAFTGN